jgi:hypothetical protein
MDEELRKLVQNLKPIDKSRISYAKIDRGMRGAVRLLNRLPFLATVSCCAGHPTICDVLGKRKWRAEFHVAFEVYDEGEYGVLTEKVCSATSKDGITLEATKIYPSPFIWKWACTAEGRSRCAVNRTLSAVRHAILEQTTRQITLF